MAQEPERGAITRCGDQAQHNKADAVSAANCLYNAHTSPGKGECPEVK
jgi:hypothetical protein